MFTFTRCIATWHVCSIKKVMKFIPNYHIFVIARVFVMTTPTTFIPCSVGYFSGRFFRSYPIHYLKTSGLLTCVSLFYVIHSYILPFSCLLAHEIHFFLSIYINGALHDNVSTENEPWVNLANRLMCIFICSPHGMCVYTEGAL